MLRFTGIKETVLYVSDLQRTQEFYTGILGLPLISRRDGSHVFFRAGRDVLLCFLPEVSRVKQRPPGHFAYGEQHFAFECPPGEYEGWKKLLTDRGIDIEDEQDWGGGCLSFYFRDPDRHCVEILMPGLWD